MNVARMWWVPDPDNLIVISDETGIHVLGDEGPRPITAYETLRWMMFRHWLFLTEQPGS